MTARSAINITSLVQILLLSGLFLFTPMPASALSNDAQQPIQIEADSLMVRDKEKTSTYTGNVRLNQGSIKIRCEQLTLYFGDNKELILMKMTGAPATFRLLDDQQQELRGEAEQMEYRISESILILIGNAMFTHAGDTIESNQIQVDTNSGSVEAGGSESDGRVRTLIQPKQE
jgi:lipopolysaccharide export system protein LptA